MFLSPRFLSCRTRFSTLSTLPVGSFYTSYSNNNNTGHVIICCLDDDDYTKVYFTRVYNNNIIIYEYSYLYMRSIYFYPYFFLLILLFSVFSIVLFRWTTHRMLYITLFQLDIIIINDLLSQDFLKVVINYCFEILTMTVITQVFQFIWYLYIQYVN